MRKASNGLAPNQTGAGSIALKSSHPTIDKLAKSNAHRAQKLGAASQNRTQTQYLLNKSIEFLDDKALNTLGEKQRKLYPVFPQKSSLPPVQYCNKKKSKENIKSNV